MVRIALYNYAKLKIRYVRKMGVKKPPDEAAYFTDFLETLVSEIMKQIICEFGG